MDWQDDESTADYEIEETVDDDPEADQLACPSCGELVYDDTDRCPHCGDWVMPLAATTSRPGTWVWWTALALAVALLVTWGLLG